jgi:uncharacterized Fe-S center protein
MPSDVFLTEITTQTEQDHWHQKTQKLLRSVGIKNTISPNHLVAVKMHFGEKGNVTHLQPRHIKPIVRAVKRYQARPFLMDTSVLYRGKRADAVSHIELAHRHGFTLDKVDAPVIIADGLVGDDDIEIKVDGKVFDEVSIAREALKANAMIVVSHVTGHMGTGLAATIKNLGMGLASRKGKMRQHSSMKPDIDMGKCKNCSSCLEWCPEDAISQSGSATHIDSRKCIGCGECLTVCRYDAVKYNWATESAELQRRVAEYALGAVCRHPDKFIYFNFLINVTKDCDCVGRKMKPVIPDIGIIVSRDPVAADKAAVDVISAKAGKPFRELAYAHIDETVQLNHAQVIGLGRMEYQLKVV